MDSNKPNREQILAQGKRIYAERLRDVAERDHWGEFLVVDIQTGDFEIGKRDADATLSILKRQPTALLYGVRIGDNVAYRFGHGKVGNSR